MNRNVTYTNITKHGYYLLARDNFNKLDVGISRGIIHIFDERTKMVFYFLPLVGSVVKFRKVYSREISQQMFLKFVL